MSIKVKTTDLKPGDVVLFADLRDEVVSVETGSSCVVRVNSNRRIGCGNPVSTHFWCGRDAIHDVERNFPAFTSS